VDYQLYNFPCFTDSACNQLRPYVSIVQSWRGNFHIKWRLILSGIVQGIRSLEGLEIWLSVHQLKTIRQRIENTHAG